MFVLFSIGMVFAGFFIGVYARQRSWPRVMILCGLVAFMAVFMQVTMHYSLTHRYYGGYYSRY